jgi:phage terminase large subunit-like protein
VKRTRKRRNRAARKVLTLGRAVGAWIQANLVHGDGDYFGKPFLLEPFQWPLLEQMYALLPDGTRRYDEVLIGLPKGQGKTPLAAAVACAEFAGPVVFADWQANGMPEGVARLSPDIPVAACSYEQADNVFKACRAMIRHGALGEDCEVFDTEILFKDDRPGRMYKVPAVAGANDGGFHSFFVADELHEWVGPKERVYLVLSNNRAKRRGAWQLAITTAGWDMSTLLGNRYAEAQRAAEQSKHSLRDGLEVAPRSLVIWWEASPDWDLEDPAQLEQAIREANPAVGSFLPIENIIAQYDKIPEHEFRRYFLNQFTAAPSQWLETALWEAAKGDPVLDGEEIVLGFDGSYNRDSTALVGCTIDRPRLITLGVWERPPGVKEWTVPREEVIQAIEEAIARYAVRSFVADDTFGRIWATDLEGFAAKGIEVMEWPTRSQSRIAPAAAQFYGAIKDRRLTHDGDATLAAHIGHCVAKGTRWGLVPTKSSPDSPLHIDAAIAAIIAYDAALRQTAGSWDFSGFNLENV